MYTEVEFTYHILQTGKNILVGVSGNWDADSGEVTREEFEFLGSLNKLDLEGIVEDWDAFEELAISYLVDCAFDAYRNRTY